MHPNYPAWPFHNFAPHSVIDRTIYQFYRDRYGPLLERSDMNQREWHQLYPRLIESIGKNSPLHAALQAHNVVFRNMCRLVQIHFRALPEAHMLDVKLSLLADLLSGSKEEKIIEALGISANHPALQDRSFNAAVRKALVKTQFRKVFVLLINKLKTWLK